MDGAVASETNSMLGTKSYWDNVYEDDLENYKSFGDVGEVWFGKIWGHRIVNWLEESGLSPVGTKILDIGCGNGMLLCDLQKAGFVQLTGLDYSSHAIELAKDVLLKRFVEAELFVMDILHPPPESFSKQFDVIVDKGTFDALSLRNDGAETIKIYRKQLEKLWDAKSSKKFLILVSCNFTKNELLDLFCDLKFIVEITTGNSFSFGGSTGKSVTGVIFEKM